VAYRFAPLPLRRTPNRHVALHQRTDWFVFGVVAFLFSRGLMTKTSEPTEVTAFTSVPFKNDAKARRRWDAALSVATGKRNWREGWAVLGEMIAERSIAAMQDSEQDTRTGGRYQDVFSGYMESFTPIADNPGTADQYRKALLTIFIDIGIEHFNAWYDTKQPRAGSPPRLVGAFRKDPDNAEICERVFGPKPKPKADAQPRLTRRERELIQGRKDDADKIVALNDQVERLRAARTDGGDLKSLKRQISRLSKQERDHLRAWLNELDASHHDDAA
jgi:hypothetical protein